MLRSQTPFADQFFNPETLQAKKKKKKKRSVDPLFKNPCGTYLQKIT